ERAFDVHGARGERILHRARNGAERAEVIDDFYAADRRMDSLVRAELALDHLDFEPVEILSVPGREVVQDANLVAAFDQRLPVAHWPATRTAVRARKAPARGRIRRCRGRRRPERTRSARPTRARGSGTREGTRLGTCGARREAAGRRLPVGSRPASRRRPAG